MSTETVLVSEVIPATKERLYAAWLDSTEHSAFTADVAAIEPYVGGSHSTFSGYATGEVLALEPNRRIVQSWRSSDFPEGAADSRLEVTFEETAGGTMITLLHTGIPSGQSDQYRDSWLQYYLQRMKQYFAGSDEDSNGVSDGVPDGGSEDDEELVVEVPTLTNVMSADIDDEEEAETAVLTPPPPPPARRRPPSRGAKSAPKPAQAAKSARRATPTKAKTKTKARPAAKTKVKAAARRPAVSKAKAKAKPKAKPKAAARSAKRPAKKPTKPKPRGRR
jgi:uncharacterized protein YndB with AHSA1/START domain